MKKYLQFLKLALKSQREYRVNFFTSIITMIINDACFIIIFLIFVSYFSEAGLTLWNFLVLISLTTMSFGLFNWLFFNIWELPDIIESWKLDYYLSFPVKTLPFLTTNKVWIIDLWDTVFSIICLIIYAFFFWDWLVWIIILKWFLIIIISCIAVAGLYLLFWSISFWLQKWSKIQELFKSMFPSLWEYPPEIYKDNKIVYIIMCVLLFPSIILPYKMMLWSTTIYQWILLIWLALLIFGLWIFIFKKWLKKYSSGSLIHQM